MKTFKTRKYTVDTGRPGVAPLTLAVLTDLHGIRYGEGNSTLVREILNGKPDVVLVLGDMLNRMDEDSRQAAEELFVDLALCVPVYYALGNHEYSLKCSAPEAYQAYEDRLVAAGIRFLHNENQLLIIKDTPIRLYGLELPLIYYKKPFPPKLSGKTMQELIGKPDPNAYNILLAHSPKFGEVYFQWGADLILCGHYHGGMIRFSERIGLISPYFHPFPRFCCGMTRRNNQTMVVSPGLGEHTIPIRIHNPRELLFLTCS
jgi:predicted MPP superfamily phosphohydrolase